MSIKKKRGNAILIQGKKAGKAVITAKYKKKKYRCKVTVSDQKADVIPSGQSSVISVTMNTVKASNSLTIKANYPCSITIEPSSPELLSIRPHSEWTGTFGSVYVTALPKAINDLSYGLNYWDYFSLSQIRIKSITTYVIVKNSLNPEEADFLPIEIVLFYHLVNNY